ncbi:MAG: DUF2249 domain-containing protein [Verrucomicrobiae bacterium]|nr:DUF2249 domain-containing protein [Verrucomicrobiae bacterium]
MKTTHEVLLDVREDLRAGRQPLGQIMAAAKSLAPDQSLRLVSPFQPTPLFSVLGNLGFSHECRQIAEDHWETLFTRKAAAAAADAPPAKEAAPTAAASPAREARVEVDARGLEPPEPMMRILEALEKLGAGGTLRAITDRRPVHLIGILDERGVVHSGEGQPDGSWITEIRKGRG